MVEEPKLRITVEEAKGKMSMAVLGLHGVRSFLAEFSGRELGLLSAVFKLKAARIRKEHIGYALAGPLRGAITANLQDGIKGERA